MKETPKRWLGNTCKHSRSVLSRGTATNFVGWASNCSEMFSHWAKALRIQEILNVVVPQSVVALSLLSHPISSSSHAESSDESRSCWLSLQQKTVFLFYIQELVTYIQAINFRALWTSLMLSTDCTKDCYTCKCRWRKSSVRSIRFHLITISMQHWYCTEKEI